VKKDDVKISVKENVLSIKGERKEETTNEDSTDKKYHRKERRYGSFVRSFSLPEDALASDVKAQFKDGVLTVNIPRREPQKTQTIDVNID
jgi:HSP20 family protein